VFVNHQQDDWVQWLPFADFAEIIFDISINEVNPIFCSSICESEDDLCRRAYTGTGPTTLECGSGSGYNEAGS
jgi:hypothetical protein